MLVRLSESGFPNLLYFETTNLAHSAPPVRLVLPRGARYDQMRTLERALFAGASRVRTVRVARDKLYSNQLHDSSIVLR